MSEINTDGQPSVTALLEQLRDPLWEIRQKAARQLQDLQSPNMLDQLIQVINDPHNDLTMRSICIETLGNLGHVNETRIEEILSLTMFDQDWEIQLATMRTLAQIWKEPVMRQIGDRLPEKRILGINTLANKKDPKYHRVFLATLDDESPEVRLASIRALSKVKATEAIETLRQMYTRESDELRVWIAEALDFLGVPLKSDTHPDRPAHLLPCGACQHLLPPSQLKRIAYWQCEPFLLCQFHFEEFLEKIDPFEGKFRNCKWCNTYWPKVELVEGSCPPCRSQRYDNLPELSESDLFRCFRCHKTFPLRNQSPTCTKKTEPICVRCAYQIATLSPNSPFFTKHAIHFLSENFENGLFLCEVSHKFCPLEQLAQGTDFRDYCISLEHNANK